MANKRPPNPRLPEFIHDWSKPALIATQGLPGSGKSTWAQEMTRRHWPNVVRCNRDDIRESLGFIYDPSREGQVTAQQDQDIDEYLEKGLTVITDDTHLNPKYIRDREASAARWGVPFVMNDSFMQVPVWTCIARDRTRGEHSVGKDVIEELYFRYWSFREKPENDGPYTCIMCDLDGTLAMIPHGANTYKRDFTKDKINEAVRDILRANVNRHAIFLMSGREEADRELTLQFLEQNQVPFAKLYMRDTDDNRPDTIVKKELYMRHIQGQCRVIYVMDDRPSVVRMWRAECGLTVFQPAPNIEF